MSHPLLDISGRAVLVTGSSRGMGRAMARALLEAGCKVVLHGSNPDRARQAAADLASSTEDAEVHHVAFDIANPGAVAAGVARALGATDTLKAGEAEETQDDFDVAIEASGAPAALGACVRGVVRGGTVVQLGIFPPGEVPFLGNLLVTKGIDVRGAFRFHEEFDDALQLLADGLEIDALVTATVPLDQAEKAFELASDRRRASKVLLDLQPDHQS